MRVSFTRIAYFVAYIALDNVQLIPIFYLIADAIRKRVAYKM